MTESPDPVQRTAAAGGRLALTSLAALDILGPRYRWRTHAFATGDIDGGR